MAQFGNAEIVVFWDSVTYKFSCCANPEYSSPYILDALKKNGYNGPVMSISVYGDKIEPSLMKALTRTGIEVINVPEKAEEGPDKRIAVDMLLRANDDHEPTVFLVISKSKNLVFSMETLRNRGHKVLSELHGDIEANGEMIEIWK